MSIFNPVSNICTKCCTYQVQNLALVWTINSWFFCSPSWLLVQLEILYFLCRWILIRWPYQVYPCQVIPHKFLIGSLMKLKFMLNTPLFSVGQESPHRMSSMDVLCTICCKNTHISVLLCICSFPMRKSWREYLTWWVSCCSFLLDGIQIVYLVSRSIPIFYSNESEADSLLQFTIYAK